MSRALTPRVTVAISATGLWIARYRRIRRGSDVAAFELAANTSNEWPDLARCVRNFLQSEGLRSACARVVVLPPLVLARVLELPRMKPEEIQVVIERTPERYFPVSREPHLIATRFLSNSRGKPSRVLAGALPLRVAALIRQELATCGVSVSSIVCAHEIWLAQARRERRSSPLVVNNGATFEQMDFVRGRLAGIRRGPRDFSAHDASGTVPALIESPGESAVRHAHRATRLVLRDSAEQIRVERVRWRKTLLYVASAAVLLALSGFTELRRQNRELERVRAARAALRPQLADAIAVQYTALEGRDAFRNLQALELGAERWTKVTTRIARALPEDARLVSIRTRSDAVTLEGYSADPSRTFAALNDSHLFDSLAVATPIVRERTLGGEPALRFVFEGRLATAAGP